MKLTTAEKDKLDNTCGNLRITKLGSHIKELEDFIDETALNTNAKTVAAAINELYNMIVNKDCSQIQVPPPGFFTLWGNDADGKLYCYYNNEDYPPVFRHEEDPTKQDYGSLYLCIADPQGNNHYELLVGEYIAVSTLEDYYTKSESNTRFGVTVEKQASAESGFHATYILKQNNVQTGVKINIPKDFLVKSASVEVCSTADTPVVGYNVGDKYMDFVINSKDNTGTDEHLYINVKDLVDTYTADESTLTLSNNQFSVKNSGISISKLDSNLQSQIGVINNLATVATSGSYNDLQDTPNIPTGVTVVDTVADNNMNAVSSNAVYEYVDSIVGNLSNYITS